MRRQSREMALQILFQREFAPQVELEDFISMLESPPDKDTIQFTRQLIDGVAQHQEDINTAIQAASRHWKLDRMSVVDRSLLRIATFEIRHLKTQPKIAIDEAVEIAKKYGNNDSAAFVNGVLDQISKGS